MRRYSFLCEVLSFGDLVGCRHCDTYFETVSIIGLLSAITSYLS